MVDFVCESISLEPCAGVVMCVKPLLVLEFWHSLGFVVKLGSLCDFGLDSKCFDFGDYGTPTTWLCGVAK